MPRFEPAQLVLVRENDTQVWRLTYYSHTVQNMDLNVTIDGKLWASQFIIPYAGNEHLLGNEELPVPKCEPKIGELVAVSDTGEEDDWEPCIYRGMSGNSRMPYRASRLIRGDRKTYNWAYCEPVRAHFAVPE